MRCVCLHGVTGVSLRFTYGACSICVGGGLHSQISRGSLSQFSLQNTIVLLPPLLVVQLYEPGIYIRKKTPDTTHQIQPNHHKCTLHKAYHET